MKNNKLHEGMGSVNVETQYDVSRIRKLAGLANSTTATGTAYADVVEAEGEPSGVPHLTAKLAGDILEQCETDGAKAIVKSIEWGDGASRELLDLIKDSLRKVASLPDSEEM